MCSHSTPLIALRLEFRTKKNANYCTSLSDAAVAAGKARPHAVFLLFLRLFFIEICTLLRRWSGRKRKRCNASRPAAISGRLRSKPFRLMFSERFCAKPEGEHASKTDQTHKQGAETLPRVVCGQIREPSHSRKRVDGPSASSNHYTLLCAHPNLRAVNAQGRRSKYNSLVCVALNQR